VFSFLKRHRPQEQFYESELTVRERSLRVFSSIEGLDDIKEMMLRAVESSERAHTLLIGRPASAKSLFMLQIEKFLGHGVYFAEGASTTKAGIQKFVAENPHKEIIIVDEIDKMPIKDQEGLLSMMERGEFTSTKVRNTKTVKANMVIFATSNSTERLSKYPLHYLHQLRLNPTIDSLYRTFYEKKCQIFQDFAYFLMNDFV
jgi:DNA replicative helicase MCM subunit Mcm2 (Cdc46/Mcm family)